VEPSPDPALEPTEEARLPIAWGPSVELATGESGVPFMRLPVLRVVNVNTKRSAMLRLYDAFGRVDEGAAAQLDDLLSDARDPDNVHVKELDRRVYRIIYRAAYHFRSKTVELISGYREPGSRSEGRHGEARAVDFRLPNVSAPALGTYLRAIPRSGVGVYTNAYTRFVHLDHRDKSYHWLDASPPGRRWRERMLGSTFAMVKRDATYAPAIDWPEGTVPSPLALSAAAEQSGELVLDASEPEAE
jgi:uncharacterized protein YcbK (DUF882 family)